MLLRISYSTLWIGCAVGSIACAGDEVTHRGDLADDLGHVIVLDAPASRVVSLSPAITELLFAIGAGDRVVGRTQWGEYPASVREVPSVGDGLNPNIELVAAQRPDLVAFYASAANSQAIKQLSDLGIASISLRLDSLASVARAARFLGRITGAAELGNRLAMEFEASLDSARAAVLPLSGPRVVIVTWDNPPIIIGGTSFLSELIELAGGHNVFDHIREPSATVTIETIAEQDPDALVSFADEIPAFAERPEWQTVVAVRERRFALVTGSEFSYPSPRALQAIRGLRAALERISR